MAHFQRFLKDDSGQAIIEFFMLLLAVIAVVGTLKTSIKSVTVKLWVYFARRIAAPCPGCDAGEQFDL